MHLKRHALARLAWIVSVAILLAALLPLMSHALGTQQGGSFAEICSATGARFVWQTDAGSEEDGKSPAASASMNCPYCALHHGAPSLPPAALAWAPPSGLRFERPALFLHAPRPLFAWAPALARGPPVTA